MAYEFPYLSLNSDNAVDQATMLLRAFAHQTIIFEKFSDSSNTLSDLVLAAGLVGFTIMIISWLFNKIELDAIIAWCILFLITVTGYVSDTLFFTPLESNINWLNSPYCAVEGAVSCPVTLQTAKEDLAADGISPEKAGASSNKGILMFSPQIWSIHFINILRAEFAKIFEGLARDGLSTRFQALRMIQSTNVLDYRPHYDMALFMQMCGRKVPALSTPEWVNSAVWLTPKDGQQTPEFRELQAQLQGAKITLGDILDAHDFYWAERNRIQPSAPAQTTQAQAGVRYVQTLGLPVLGVLKDQSKLSQECKAVTAQDGSVRDLSAICERLPITKTIFYKDSSWQFAQYIQDPLKAHTNVEALKVAIQNQPDGVPEMLRRIEIPFRHARMKDAGTIEDDSNWLNSLLGSDWGDDGRVVNCAQFQKKVSGSFQDAILTQGRFDSSIGDVIQQRLQGQPKSVEDLTQPERARLAYDVLLQEIQATAGCAADNSVMLALAAGAGGMPVEIPGCSAAEAARLRQDLQRIHNYMLSAAMTNAMPETEAIVARAGRADGYFSSFRNAAGSISEGLAPAVIFFTALFGGFQAGTYSAIMPNLLTWFLGLTIVATPFLYMIGLVVPQWSMGVLMTPIIGVIYFKSVELSFVLIKGMFRVISGIDSHTGKLESNLQNFHDILLGMAYTSAFAVSLVLLFGLRNPAGLIQGIAGKVDSLAKVSAQEALQMAGSVLAAGKMAAAFLPGGAAVKALGAVAGTVEDVATKGVVGSIAEGYADTFTNAKGDSQQGRRDRNRSAQLLRKIELDSSEDIDFETSAMAKDHAEKKINLQGKGMGVGGADRNGKTYQRQTEDGQMVTVQADPANLQLAEAIGRELGKGLQEAGRIANKLMSTGAVKASYNTPDGKQVELKIDSTRGENVMRSLGDVDKLKAAINTINTKKT
ncbi:MAG: hypothetical protein GC134_09960 [Proteobacteria bacterium]|nr:hypothetical protein [Pseudomonadota bacterium]